MPLYRCTAPDGALNDTQCAAIAEAITAIHCELTGAPRTFVHVQFCDSDPAAASAGIELHGGIRAGRDLALRETLIARCIEAVARIGSTPAANIRMRTSATQASWILEGGRVTPEPGEEDAWIAGH